MSLKPKQQQQQREAYALIHTLTLKLQLKENIFQSRAEQLGNDMLQTPFSTCFIKLECLRLFMLHKTKKSYSFPC